MSIAEPLPAGHLSNLSNRLPTPTLTHLFTVVFYGLRIFCCKTAQSRVTACEFLTTELPSVRDAVQRSESARRNSFLN